MANQHSNKPILIARDGKLLPLYMEPPIFVGDTNIVMGGCAPVTVTLSGTTDFCYFPSDVHSVTTSGDALIVVSASGLLCVDYKVPPYGAILGGQANITTKLNGVTEFCYFPTCGVTMGGEAGVDVQLGDKARGGKGTPYFRRQRQEQATHYYFKAEAYFENTLQISGEAEAIFKPAPYQFIKSLPKVQLPDPKRDSEFVDLFKKELAKPQTTKFTYRAEGGVTAKGTSDDEYFDFLDFIINHDEDLIVSDILSDDGFPLITTTFDPLLEQQRREDEELIEILDLL